MKRAALICPERRKGLEDFTGGLPLALASYLGKPFIDHALHGLAFQGVKEVRVLASDRPAEVRGYIGNGSAWGLQVEVVSSPTEMLVEDVRRKYGWEQDDQVMVLDRLPQAPEVPVMDDFKSWHSSRGTLLPLLAPGQIGVREQSPGVWLGLKARVAPSARIEAPCWIGHNTIVGSGARIGPNGFIENDSLVDAHAEVVNSTVGARTFLGGMTHLSGSIASGPMLANWSNASVVRMTDAFLLSRLDAKREAASSFAPRLLAALTLVITSPAVLGAFLLAPLRRKPWCISHRAAIRGEPGEPVEAVTYHEFSSLPKAWSRWPRLWRIVTGDFSWTGNPPLDPEVADELESEFERLWLQAPPALFTAPEAEGCTEPWDDAAKAHAALFASQPTFSWRRRILVRGLLALFRTPKEAS